MQRISLLGTAARASNDVSSLPVELRADAGIKHHPLVDIQYEEAKQQALNDT